MCCDDDVLLRGRLAPVGVIAELVGRVREGQGVNGGLRLVRGVRFAEIVCAIGTTRHLVEVRYSQRGLDPERSGEHGRGVVRCLQSRGAPACSLAVRRRKVLSSTACTPTWSPETMNRADVHWRTADAHLHRTRRGGPASIIARSPASRLTKLSLPRMRTGNVTYSRSMSDPERTPVLVLAVGIVACGGSEFLVPAVRLLGGVPRTE